MTIEKEAQDCVYPENNPMDAFWKSICDEHPCIGEELESIRFRIAKALQAKQDRILELEEKVRKYKWEWESACERERATNERVKDFEQESKGRMDQIVYAKAELRRCYDKINELENELRAYDLDIYGADGAKEMSNMRKRIAELESVLKANIKEWNDFNKIEAGHVCDAKIRLHAVSQRAKKAIGGNCD